MNTESEALSVKAIPDLTIIIPLKADDRNISRVKNFVKNTNFPIRIVIDGKHDDVTQSTLNCLVDLGCSNLSIWIADLNSPGLARNIAIEGIKTDFLAFFDSDDIYPEESVLQAFLGFVTVRGLDMCAGNYEFKNQAEITSKVYQASEHLEHLLLGKVGIWRFIFRTDFVEANDLRFGPLRMGEDVLFLLDCLSAGPIYENYEEVVYTYIAGDPKQATNTNVGKHDFPAYLGALTGRFKQSNSSSLSELISVIWIKTVFFCLLRCGSSIRHKTLGIVFRTLLLEPRIILLGILRLQRGLKVAAGFVG